MRPRRASGKARVYGNLEQRWFPDFEILTLAPVVVVFGSVGETAATIKDIRRKDLIYVAGIGVRLAQTKSISRLINKIDVSFSDSSLNKPNDCSDAEQKENLLCEKVQSNIVVSRGCRG